MTIIIVLLLLSFLCFFVKLCKSKSLTLSIGIIFLIELMWEIVSCAYLDYGNSYISETGRYSYYTGAFFRMILLYLPFIIIVSSKFSGKINNVFKERIYFKKLNYNKLVNIILSITLFVIMYCIVDMIISGIPLFSQHINRINFSRYSKLPFATKLNGEITFFGVFVAGISYFYADNKTNKRLSIFIIILSFVYRILMEYKYQGMYNILFAFFLPKLINWLEEKDYKIIKLTTLIKCFFILSFALIFFDFTYKIVSTNKDSTDLLMNRIFSLQAHTFWEMDELAYVIDSNVNGYEESLSNEINAIANNLGQMDKNSGIINVMYKVSNKMTVDANLENGVRWAGSYLTVGINTVGYFKTFILSLLLGFLLVFDIKMLYCSIKNGEFVSLYFAQSFYWDLLDYFRIGNWCLLINLKTIIAFLILIFIYLFKRKKFYFNKKISIERI